MSKVEKIVHRLFISLVFSIMNWMLIDWLIIELPVWKYFVIELFLVISMKFYIFTTRKMKL
jgi:hypothetical protein